MSRVIDATLKLVDDFSKPLGAAVDKITYSSRKIKDMGRSISNTGKSVAGVGRSLTTSITMPVAALGAASVKTAMDFEAGMSKVQSISGASASELDKLTDKALEMGAQTKFSATEAADAFSYMAMAGWKTNDMMAGIEGIMYLAGATGEDLAATSDIVTDALTAFGMSADETTGFVDTLAAAATNSNTNVSLMGETFKYIAPVAGALGYSAKDTAIAIGVMANSGIKASTAGTSLRSLLTNLSKPTDAVSVAMKKLGISLTDAEGNMRPLRELMGDMRGAFSGLTEDQKAQYAATLAGKQGMSGLLAIVNASEGDFNKLTAAIDGSAGAAKEMYDVANNNLSGQLTILKSTVESIAIQIGSKLTPYIKALTEKLQSAAEWFKGLSDEQQNMVIKIALIAASVGPALLVIGKLTTGIGGAVTSFGKLATSVRKAGGTIGWLKSPGIIVVGVLAAIVAAGILVAKNWDKITAAAKRMGSFVKSVMEKIGINTEEMNKAVESAKGAWNKLAGAISKVWGKIKPVVTAVGGLFTRIFKVVLGAAVGAAIGKLGSIIDTVAEVGSGIMSALGGLIDFVTGVFTGNWAQAWEGVKSIFGGAFQALVGLAKAPINAVIGIINGAIAGINSIGVDIPEWVPLVGGKSFHIAIPTIPMLAKGTDFWTGGTAMINERGAEIVDLPRGSRVYPADESIRKARKDGEAASSRSTTITINKLADNLTVRKDADIDAIVEQMAEKIGMFVANGG